MKPLGLRPDVKPGLDLDLDRQPGLLEGVGAERQNHVEHSAKVDRFDLRRRASGGVKKVVDQVLGAGRLLEDRPQERLADLDLADVVRLGDAVGE